MALSTVPYDEDVYEIPASLADELSSPWRANASNDEVTPATRSLIMSVPCPHCGEWLRTVHVVGLGRTSVDGAQSLVAFCPDCEGIVPAELAAL